MCQAFRRHAIGVSCERRHANCEAFTRHTNQYVCEMCQAFTRDTNQESPRVFSSRITSSRRPSDVSLQKSQTSCWHSFEKRDTLLKSETHFGKATRSKRATHTFEKSPVTMLVFIWCCIHSRAQLPPSLTPPLTHTTAPPPLYYTYKYAGGAVRCGFTLGRWVLWVAVGGGGRVRRYGVKEYIPSTLHSPAHNHSLRPPSLSHTQHSWL